MKCRLRIACLLLSALSTAAEPRNEGWLTLYARVLEVKDGNNLRVIDPERCVHQVRLAGLDAPELSQSYGMDAKKRLKELVLKKNVRIVHRWFDERGRILGKVYIGDVWANEALVREGLAWFYDPDGDAPELEKAKREAKAGRKGLWRATNPVPPWWFRRGSMSYRPGMENRYPRVYPRKRSSNKRALLGVGY